MKFKILGVQHVAVAVKESAPVLASLKDLFGIGVGGSEIVASQKVKTDFVSIGKTTFEFLEATDSDSPISKFLEKRGNGVHHIALQVDNIEEAIKFLKSKGVQMIDEKPRTGAHNSLTAFLHPKAFHGILLELVQEKS